MLSTVVPFVHLRLDCFPGLLQLRSLELDQFLLAMGLLQLLLVLNLTLPGRELDRDLVINVLLATLAHLTQDLRVVSRPYVATDDGSGLCYHRTVEFLTHILQLASILKVSIPILL